jgi:hypothetical protein
VSSPLFEAYRALRRGNRALKRDAARFEGALWSVTPEGISRSVNDHLMIVRPSDAGEAEVVIVYPDGQSKTYA